MIGDHYDPTAGKATLLVRTVDGEPWMGTHRVDLAGDVALEAADDLGLGLSFFGAALYAGAGGRVRARGG